MGKNGLLCEELRRLFREKLEPVYRERAKVQPVRRTVRGDADGQVERTLTLAPHEMVFVMLKTHME